MTTAIALTLLIIGVATIANSTRDTSPVAAVLSLALAGWELAACLYLLGV